MKGHDSVQYHTFAPRGTRRSNKYRYTVYREVCATGTSEGVAILVRRDVPSSPLSQAISNPVEPTEGTHMVTVELRLKYRYTFTCVYRRPRAGFTSVRLLLQHAQARSRHVGMRNNLRNIFQRSRDHSLKPGINAIANLVRDWKTSLWHEQLRRTHDDHRQYFRLVKTYVSKRRSIHLTAGSELLTTGERLNSWLKAMQRGMLSGR